ncbi:MAG: nucleotidyltransferase domain-containing protein [Bacteroidetes bacterium]|nr:nucleotidyltransferase domain-containing protein [Bacteroidota bacterium]MBU1116002.1 nucleotidyltransferase domain-containing protein [Bacteroidota bacterium]MBU1799230.1 nucleotidyltransferase domain-containing protein [Bacteroidota bacterium]
MNKAIILKTLKEYKTLNQNRYGIKSIGVFGSYSRNEENENSDIDIVIETKTPDLFQLVHIKEELELLLKTKVDLIRKRGNMNPILMKRINTDASYV